MVTFYERLESLAKQNPTVRLLEEFVRQNAGEDRKEIAALCVAIKASKDISHSKSTKALLFRGIDSH